jgi:hypothetical protein
MTLREAMELLDLNERTLDSSMLESALQHQLKSNPSIDQREQLLEAYERVNIFLDPSADERFALRNSNVLVALSGEYPIPQNIVQDTTNDQLMLTQEILILDENRDVLEDAPLTAPRANQAVPQALPPKVDSALLDAPLLSGELLSGNVVETEALNPHQTFDESLLLAPQTEIAPSTTETDPETVTGNITIEDEQPSPIAAAAPVPPTKPKPASLAARPSDTSVEAARATSVQNATRATSVHMGDGLDATPLPETPPKPSKTKANQSKLEKSASSTPKTASQPVNYGFGGAPVQPDRRTSRSSKNPPVKRSYTDSDQTSVRPLGARKPKRKNQTWIWALALLGLIGAGVFAAPGLMRTFSSNFAANPATRTQKTSNAAPVLTSTPTPLPRSDAPVQTAPIKAKATGPKTTKTKTTNSAQPKPTPATQKTAPISTKPLPKKPTVTPEERAAAAKRNAVTRREASSLPQIPGTQAAPRIPSAEKLPQISNPKDLTPAAKPSATKPSASKPRNQGISFRPPVVDPDNLTREQVGRQFLNQQYFENWFNQGAQLKYVNWSDIPIELQVAPYAEFRAAVYLSPPPPAPSEPEPNPSQPIPHSP